MSKERLEEIKMKANNTTEPMLYVPYSDFNWLIEQAEQNKRYREAMRNAMDELESGDFLNAEVIIFDAMEDDENE